MPADRLAMRQIKDILSRSRNGRHCTVTVYPNFAQIGLQIITANLG